MQREHRHLDAQPDNDERDGGRERPVPVDVREPLRQVGHVERAGDGVRETDTDQQAGTAGVTKDGQQPLEEVQRSKVVDLPLHPAEGLPLPG